MKKKIKVTAKKMNLLKLSSRSLDFLNHSDRIKVVLLTFAQLIVSFMDAVGLISLGVLVSIGISYSQNGYATSDSNTFLHFLHLSDLSSEYQMLVFGLIAILLLTGRTVISLFLSRKTFLFLGRKSAEISAKLMLTNFKSNFSWLRRENVEKIAFGLTEGVNFLITGVISSTVALVTEIGLLMLILGLLAIVNFKMAIFALLFFTLIGMIIYFNINKRISEISNLKSLSVVEGNKQIAEIHALYREIHVTQSWDYFEKRFLKNRIESSKLFGLQSWLLQIPRMSVEIAIVLGGACLAVVSITGSSVKEALPDIVMFLAATSRLAPSVLRIQQSAVAIRGFAGAASDFLRYQNDPQPIKPESFEAVVSESTPITSDVNLVLSLKNISFKFNDVNDYLIRNVTIDFKPGEIVALIGASGAGKSTICDLIFGVQSPTVGSVSISGFPVSEYLALEPGFVSYLPQDVHILEDSIEKNVAFGVDPENIDIDRVKSVLKDSGLPEFCDFKSDSRTNQDNNKIQMSGGQRQRLGLARALYSNPSILILDEPTSSLDAETEALVMGNLREHKKERITIIVAHREATINSADRIVLLKEGRLTEV